MSQVHPPGWQGWNMPSTSTSTTARADRDTDTDLGDSAVGVAGGVALERRGALVPPKIELGGGAGAEHWDSLDPGPELELDMEPGHRSPNKRHRSTPKPQNIQRPCLDFEKMQQVEHNIYNTRHILTISVFRLRLKLSPLGGKEQNFPYSAGKGNSEKTVSAPQYIPVLLSPANIYQCRTQLHFKRSEPQELKLFSEF